MFIIKAVAFSLLSLNIVSCSELSSDAKNQEQNDGRSPRRLHRYDQQESVSIPVAIVLDDLGDRKGKSIDTIVSKTNTNISPEKDKETKKSNTPTLITLSGDFSVKSFENDKDYSKQSQAKIKNENDLRIPVAVVYDEAAVTPAMQKKVLLRRKQGHRLHTPSQTEKVPKTVTPSAKVEVNKITQTNEEIKNVTTSEKTLGRQMLTHDSKIQTRTRERDPVIPIIQSENRVFAHNGDFHYSYEGGDGTKAFETGELKSFDDNKTGEAVKGGFSYTAKDGQDFSLTYTADENGYRPVGAHLPTPPPVPPAIERALRYLATKTTPETVTDSAKST